MWSPQKSQGHSLLCPKVPSQGQWQLQSIWTLKPTQDSVAAVMDYILVGLYHRYSYDCASRLSCSSFDNDATGKEFAFN